MMKLFAEQMLELLHDFTWDNYRHFALDSLTRLQEAERVCYDVQREVVPRQALDPVVEELCWSSASDPVFARAHHFDAEVFSAMISDKTRSVESIRTLINTVYRRFRDTYKREAENLLVRGLGEPNRKAAFITAIKFYCAHLICLGYHRRYILKCVRETLLFCDHDDAGEVLLRAFFEKFGGQESEYTYIGKADRHFANALKMTRVCDTFIQKNANASYVQHSPGFFQLHEKELYVSLTAKGLDPYSARHTAEFRLNAGRAMILSVPNALPLDRSSDVYLIKEGDELGEIYSPPRMPLSRRQPLSTRGSMRSISQVANNVFNEFNSSSAGRIIRAFNTGSLARTSTNLENQLISLWSAIEVLLTEPSGKTPRILHYVDLLVPCLCIRYARSVVIEFYRDLSKIYGKNFTSLVAAAPGSDQHIKFATILCAAGQENARRDLLTLCADSPLALRRADILHKALFKPAAILDLVQTHERMLRWQLHRIYRVRNSLVHSGRNPPFLEAVLGNLDEYLRATVGTILRRAAKVSGESSVDEVVSGIALEYKMYINTMKKRSGEQDINPDQVRGFFIS